jgi:hypothetical protein
MDRLAPGMLTRTQPSTSSLSRSLGSGGTFFTAKGLSLNLARARGVKAFRIHNEASQSV